MQKVISCSLSPNTEADDVAQAIRVFLHPSLWQYGRAISEVEEWFGGVSFDSGRSALLALLHAFGIGKGDEVLLQAFTCVAVPNSIRKSRATPVFVDIDDSFNIDPEDFEKKLTKQTKAVIVQHTFGVPARMDEILTIAKKRNLVVIEDCAHSLGGTYRGKRVGTLGDAAFFSFGRDKVLSSVWGGMATVNVKCQMSNVKWKLKQIQNALPYPLRGWIAQQLLHPIAFSLILPTYNVGVGKVILEVMKQARLLSLPNPPFVFPRRYPNALAQLLLVQLAKLERYNRQRQVIASYYADALGSGGLCEGAVYLRYPMLVDDPSHLIQKAKGHGILPGNWYHNVIDPKGTDASASGYRHQSCPRAQEAAAHIVNLPTLITQEEARRVVYAI